MPLRGIKSVVENIISFKNDENKDWNGTHDPRQGYETVLGVHWST